MREPIRDKARLEHILQAIDYIRQFTDGVTEDELRNDVMRRFAVIKNLEIIGEASYMLTKEFREKHSHIPWRQIINMRHILVHGYCQIKDEMLWDTIKEDIQPLKDEVTKLLENE
ncbi:DUF86 domain-containing protein [Palleniella muris]|uniref:DUF86 domain-containing protein n=1 Tax=Palleniella muris TaxID=3038145 RepID=A0AC61QQP8_9BACT|nr:DUF86 domain-containing protein [Palleniella muris]TGX82498.1 DUF86 domain-containing protein [Palleniella muris]